MGRREWKSSARLKAGMGEFEDGVGADVDVDVDAIEPAEERRAMSVAYVRAM